MRVCLTLRDSADLDSMAMTTLMYAEKSNDYVLMYMHYACHHD